MSKSIPEANWEYMPIDEPLTPAMNNVDNESMAIQEQERYKQDTHQRKFLADWVVWTNSLWLGLVILAVFFQGFGLINLDTSVMNVLLATTTVNILGLAYIVLEGLFGQSKRRIKNDR